MDGQIPNRGHLEFINIEPLNPMISRCQIKVLYEGLNRNNSYISKPVANQMAKSLPGTPIIGQYLNEIDDFGDHGQSELVIDQHGVRFVKNTIPYGFVDLNTKIWWQDFLDPDGVVRNYLVTEGYLWTGRFPEISRIIEKGNGQSMELAENYLIGEWSNIKGEWTKVENREVECFNISEAVFAGLCILGEEVPPCFEGANITRANSLNYSLNREEFLEKMLDFKLDLKEALEKEGGKEMLGKDLEKGLEQEVVNPTVPNEPVESDNTDEASFAKKKNKKDEDGNGDNSDDDKPKDDKSGENSPKDDKSDDKQKDDKSDDKPKDDKSDASSDKDEEDKKKKKAKYNLEEVVEYSQLLEDYKKLEGQYNEIDSQLKAINSEYAELKEFKANRENERKEEMIKSFYMLSDEDKKEVSENKHRYSLEEIESKLSVICVRNKVNFNLDETSKNNNNTEAPIVFNLEGAKENSAPAWLKAVDRVATKNRR